MVRRSPSRVSRPRRKLVWARASNEGAELAAGGAAGSPSAVTLLADFETLYQAQLFGATIMRVRGEIMVVAGEEPAVDVGDHTACAWGLHVIPSNLPATPSSPLDVDAQGAYSDWFGYGATHLFVSGDVSFSDTGAFNGAGFARIPVDIRARRKLDELGMTLQFVFDSAPESTFWNYHLSVLLALA